jgi:integrase
MSVEHVHFVRAVRPGKPVRWYVYAWRGGPRVKVTVGTAKPKLSEEDVALIAAENAKLTAPRDEGLLSGLIRKWRGNVLAKASPEWKALSPSTRETWGYELGAIDAKWGDKPLALWDDARMVRKVIEWRDSRAETPRAADMGVQVLNELLAFGKLRTMVALNVAADVPTIYQPADRAPIIWTDEDIEAFSWSAIAMNRPHLIDGLWLACLTGMRRADVVGLTWAEVGEHAIVRTARKRSRGRRRRAVIPLIPETVQLLEEMRTRPRETGVDTVLVNPAGKSWAAASFTARFNEVRNAANGGGGIVHKGDLSLGEPDKAKHLHDCRGTMTTRLCRTDLTNEEIANILAWSPDSVETVRRIYVDDAAVVVALSERINRAL